MPIGHQKYAEMTPEKARELANEIGMATSLIVDNLLQEAPHIAIGCRKSYGFLGLSKKYGKEVLEEACIYAINIGVYDYKNIQMLLAQKFVPGINKELHHSNIRGSSYYN